MFSAGIKVNHGPISGIAPSGEPVEESGAQQLGPVFLLKEREDSVYDLGIFDRLCKMALSSASADKLDARICAQASQPATVGASGANPRGAVVIYDPQAGARHLSPVICGVKNNDLARFDEGERYRAKEHEKPNYKRYADSDSPHSMSHAAQRTRRSAAWRRPPTVAEAPKVDARRLPNCKWNALLAVGAPLARLPQHRRDERPRRSHP